MAEIKILMSVSELQDRLEEVLDERMTVYITDDDTGEELAVLTPIEDYEDMLTDIEDMQDELDDLRL